MTERTVVVFDVENVAAEEALLREYVLPAMERLEGDEVCESVFFNRYGHDPSVDGGEVTVYVFGDFREIRARESDRWDELVAEGLVERWRIDDTPFDGEPFGREDELRVRMRATASKMAAEFFAEFEDDRPDAVDTFGTDSEFGTGAWMLLHHLINQLGYQARDGEEEIDLCFENLRNRFYFVGTGSSVENATRKCEELEAELDALPEKVAKFREERGEHVHTYADESTEA